MFTQIIFFLGKSIFDGLFLFNRLPCNIKSCIKKLSFVYPLFESIYRRSENLLRKSYFIEFLQLLNENKIPYWAFAGTLIGALRHKGIIPWDTDSDIGMFIEDCPRFYDLVSKDKRFILKSWQRGGHIVTTNLGPRELKDEQGFYVIKGRVRVVDVAFCYIDTKTIPLFWEKYLQRNKFEYGNGFVLCLKTYISSLEEGKFAIPASFMREFRFVKFYNVYIRIFDRAEEWLKIVYGCDVMTRKNSFLEPCDSGGEKLMDFSPL